MSNHPFGHSINIDDIKDTLGFVDSWEDRYKYIIDLGKDLPDLPDAKRTEDRLVQGCQSKVWIDDNVEQGKVQLTVDSDAFIVRGLLCIILAAYNNRAPEEILDFDIEAYFQEIDLMSHLSASRGNGLRAMVARIQSIARDAL
tara:strand:- start:261 stop:689 length:429 start_codon:yes stop_codon:yes gene_type:complete